MKTLLSILIVLLLALLLILGSLAYQVKGRLAQVDGLLNDAKEKMGQVDKATKQIDDLVTQAKRIMQSGENKLNQLNGEIEALTRGVFGK